ncbi:MAG: hypothetical protein K2P70_12705 [Hyphomonadaceae bacterium]|nr:hypothetical protein [Hyphomonadaceae bacterium]
MYTDEQLRDLIKAIQLDQTVQDSDAAKRAAESIGISVWAFANNADYDGENFIARSSPQDATAIAKGSRALASSLKTATQLMDALRKRRIDGHDAAGPMLATRQSKGWGYGDASTPFYAHEANRGRRIAGRAFELLDERGQVVEHYCWPSRIKELARGSLVAPAVFTPKIINDFAHDMEVAAAFYEAVADEYENKHGAQTSPGPLTFAACVMAWFGATGRLPSAHKTTGRTNSKTRPDLYELIEQLYGSPLPKGMSRETFAEVVSVLSEPSARDIYRYQYRLHLPKRKEPHEH